MKFKELHRYLNSRGYSIIRESGHHIYSNGVRSIAVPHHKVISDGTLRDIFKAIYPNDFGLANRMMRDALQKGV